MKKAIIFLIIIGSMFACKKEDKICENPPEGIYEGWFTNTGSDNTTHRLFTLSLKSSTIMAIILLVIFISCDGTNNKEVTKVEKDGNKEMKFNEIDSVISSVEVRKALLELIFKVDTIPNPYGRSVCYFLSFYKKNADTLLSLTADIDFPIILPEKKSYYELKGLFSVFGRDIALYDFVEPLGSLYYYQNNLVVKEISYQHDSLYRSYSESYEAWTYVSPYILYRINNRKLIRIDSYFGNIPH